MTIISPRRGTPGESLRVFLKLGFTSFGGPIAHLGYFREEFVVRRKWVTESQYAQLVALCQFLPGPASSQVGFSLGLLRAGWLGALAAFLAFTLPSAILLFAFAALLPFITGPAGDAAIHGLKLVAVVVVAHALLGMARQLCPDAPRATIAALAAVVILTAGQPWTQVLVVLLGALAGVRAGLRRWPCGAAALGGGRCWAGMDLARRVPLGIRRCTGGAWADVHFGGLPWCPTAGSRGRRGGRFP